jgi:hypothetical protein
MDNIRQGIANLLVSLLKYFENEVLLSVARLQFFAWLVILLWDTFTRLFRHDAYPLLSYDSNNLLIWVVGGFLVSFGLWFAAEICFDRERTAHRDAFETDLPEAQALIKTQEADIVNYINRFNLTQAALNKANRDLEIQQASNEASIREIARLQNEVRDLQAKLKVAEAKTEFRTAQAEEARARQAQAEQRANTAVSEAYNRLLSEIDPLMSNLGEFRNQVMTKLKTSSNSSPAQATKEKEREKSSTQTLTNNDHTPPQPTKKNYV